MPRSDTQAQRVQDKEAKRARGTLSCAECRRLKLKCDRTVPCTSCKRRGCSAICPNGSLVTGQGTRFVLADTEKLHRKIAQMSNRIRQLEDALEIAQAALNGPSAEPHPLLDRDLLKIKSSIELHSASLTGSVVPEDTLEVEEEEDGDDENYIDAFGTLAIRDGGAATFYGWSAGQESLLIGELTASVEDDHLPLQLYGISATSSFSDVSSEAGPSSQTYYTQRQYNVLALEGHLPENVVNLAQGFPLASSLPVTSSILNPHESVTLSTLITHFLPPPDEAKRLVQLYLQQAPWFFGAVTEKQIEEEIMPMWYEGVDNGLSSTVTPRMRTSHDLALLFMVFCFGSLTDIDLPSPPDNPISDKFYQLGKAALTLDPNAPPESRSTKNGILDRPPSVATVQTLSLMAIYEGLWGSENSIESTWLLFGLATKLAQSIGLHRDSARWKLPAAEVQKRRALFWELFITDCWQSLATGRLATFSLPFVDCELPFDSEQTIADDGSTQPSFPFWKARFGAECVSAVVQGTLTSRAPKYSIILDLDRKVRDMELPSYAHGDAPQGKSLRQTMSHFMPQNYRELTLLYIHRCFFAHAISSNPIDPIKSQYAPSFLAGYRSACTIINAVKQQFTMFSAQIARFWVLWTHAFSASVMLSSITIHAPRSKMAPAALLELKIACELFEAASKYGGRATKFLPIVRRLRRKAQQAYRDANSGMPPTIPNDIFKSSQPDEEKDELSIFSGKTHTVNAVTVSTASPPATRSSSSSQNGSPPQIYADNPSFAGVHPSLISELNSFQPFIREQVENAYRMGGDVFGGEPMVIDPIRHIPAGQISAPPPPAPPQPSGPVSVQEMAKQLQLQQMEQEQQRRVLMQQQQQLENERLERERQELERLELIRQELDRQEMERQELERLEIARQHSEQQELRRQQEFRLRELQRQQLAQQEAIHLQDQEALRRQQERAEQLQRQEQYRQRLEIQHRQLEETGQYPRFQSNSAAGVAPPTTTARQMPPPSVPNSAHALRRQLSHSRSSSNLNQVYQQAQQQITSQGMDQITPQQTGSLPVPPKFTGPISQPYYQTSMSHTQITSQHITTSTSRAPVVSQPQHSMYAIPRNEFPLPDSMNSTPSYSPQTPSYLSSACSPPPPSHISPITETYKYWPAATTSFAMPVDQLPSDVSTSNFNPHTPQLQAQPQPQYHHHYTPEGALRGIAADDSSLQETWKSFMNKVGSPRQFLED